MRKKEENAVNSLIWLVKIIITLNSSALIVFRLHVIIKRQKTLEKLYNSK